MFRTLALQRLSPASSRSAPLIVRAFSTTRAIHEAATTPIGTMHAVADFCLIPMGVDSVGVTKYIAECQRVLERTPGIDYKLHGYGTGLSGEFSVVMKAIEECHRAVHEMGCPRVATDIRIGTRTDKQGSLEGKIGSVVALLAKDKDKVVPGDVV